MIVKLLIFMMFVGLAGDAVLIAPVSGQIPYKQGILQGFSRF